MSDPSPRSKLSVPIRFRRFAGRERELSFLTDRMAAADNGCGALVLVSGPAGIGKSRLLAEFIAVVRARGGRSAIGRSRDFARRSLAPVDEIVHTLQLACVEPSLADVNTDPVARAAAMLRSCHAAEAGAGVAIAFEDVQWSDDASLDVLESLAEAVERSRLVVIATVRTEDPAYSIALRQRLARLERLPATYRMEVAPLADRVVAELITESLPPRHTPFALRDALIATSKGNAFYAEELLRLYVDEGNILSRLPGTLVATIEARTAQLARPTRDLLRALSAFGNAASIRMLENVVRMPATVRYEALREALEAQLLRTGPDDPDRVEFGHPVIRETIYASLLNAEARALHGAIVDALLAAGSADVTLLADQAWAAGDDARVALFAERAGDLAQSTGNVQQAANQFARAASAASDDGNVRYRLLHKLAQAHEASGEFLLGRDAAEEAARVAERLGRIAEAVERLIDTARMTNNGGDIASLAALGRRIDALIDSNDVRLRRRKEVGFALYYALAGHEDASARHLEAAERCVVPEETLVERQRFACARVATYALSGRPWLDEARGALALLDGESGMLSFSTNAIFAYVAHPAGETSFARRGADVMDAIARASNVPAWATGAAATLALVAWHQGELEHARSCAAEALWQSGHAAMARVMPVAGALLSGALIEDPQLVERASDLELLDAALASRDGTRLGLLAYGFSETYAGDADRRRHAAFLKRIVEALDGRGYGAWSVLVHAAAFADDPVAESARAMLAHDAARHGVVPRALLDLFDAERARRRARNGATPRTAAAAAEAFARLGWPYFEGRARELAGDLDGAAEIYARIGDRRDAARLRVGLTATPPHSGGVLTQLTRRERDVALLVAEGRTTPQIAAELVLSRRTVEAHLDSMYRKLGITTRSALAARVTVAESRFR